MSTPELPQKPLVAVTPPIEAADANVTNAASTTGDGLNYLSVLDEGKGIWTRVKAHNGTLPGKQIDLSPDPYALTPEAAHKKMEGANAFVAAFTGSESRTALNDWIFSDDKNDVKHTKGDTLIHAINPDGLAVTADFKKDKVTAGGDGWKVEHDRKTGATIYDSTAFRATEKDGIKTIEDKERGTKLQWDSKTHHGVVYDASGKVSFEF